MVLPTGTPVSAGGKGRDSTSQAGATATTASSVFGSGKTSADSALSIPLKRKITDQKLETITIDPMYDLTLVVGTPEHTKGQKAFQVNKGSFRNISAVWTKMMNGKWAEGDQSEICLPDDSCDAFHIVLQIAHFQLLKLPEKLSREELVDLAVLTDKYQLENAIMMALELKKWMKPHRQAYMSQPSDAALQDFALIASAFNLRSDYDYLISRLATEVMAGANGRFYYHDGNQKKIMLRSDLPTSIFGTHVVPPKSFESIDLEPGKIISVRSDILSAWITCCDTGLTKCLSFSLPPCESALCAATKAGILLKGLKTAGFFPSPSSATLMHGSITAYWKLLKSTGNDYQKYAPCKFIKGIDYSSAHWTDCSFETCFGDFGIMKAARAILERHMHADLWKQWQDVDYLQLMDTLEVYE
ncbi:hypothetical protein HBI45_095630 [Parastagonospora nodorum]|nr:hypothetical protein HBI45_095630 [Parastagonospora nodorum]